jgi:F0F1-type ATP synthase assembly protein I
MGTQDNNSEEQFKKRAERQLLVLWREGLRAITLGWDLAVPIFAGVFFGSFLDRWLGTQTIFTLGLMMAGVMIAFYNLGKTIQRLRDLDQVRELEKQRMAELFPEEEEDEDLERERWK